MKKLLFTLAIGSVISISANAQDVITKKEKFSCFIDQSAKDFDAAGKEVVDTTFAGKSSEGTAITWKQDGLSYKFSDKVNYVFERSVDGVWSTSPSSQAKSMRKFTRTEKDGLVVYSGESRTVKIMMRQTPHTISDTTSTYEETYSLVGDQEILVKSIYDGKETPVWISNIGEANNGNSRIVTETYQTPHYEYDAATRTTTVYSKYITSCVYEPISE